MPEAEMLQARCPYCNKKLLVRPDQQERKVRCPKCQQSFLIQKLDHSVANARAEKVEEQQSPKPQPDAFDFSPFAQPDSQLPLMVTEYISQHLMQGERLLAVTRIHPMVMLVPGIITAFGLLMCLGIVAGERGFGFVCVGLPIATIAGITLLSLLVQRMTTEFSCTDRRILIKSGLLTTQLREMPLGKVEALLMRQGLFGKLFGYGTLIFKGSGGTRRTCNNIEAPFDFYKRVQEQVADTQGRK